MIVEQMESSHNGIYWKWTCCKDVLQATMGTTRKEQSVSI